MWHYSSLSRLCSRPCGTHQTGFCLKFRPPPLSLLWDAFLILWPCSQPSATDAHHFTASSTQLHRRRSTFHHLRYFGSCNWNKMWICWVLSVFNVILSRLTCLRQRMLPIVCRAASLPGCYPWSSALMMISEAEIPLFKSVQREMAIVNKVGNKLPALLKQRIMGKDDQKGRW